MSECVTAVNKVSTRESELAATQFTEDLKAAKVAHEKKMLEFRAEMDVEVERLQRKHSEQVAQLEAKAAEDQRRLKDLYQNEQKEKETVMAELGAPPAASRASPSGCAPAPPSSWTWGNSGRAASCRADREKGVYR